MPIEYIPAHSQELKGGIVDQYRITEAPSAEEIFIAAAHAYDPDWERHPKFRTDQGFAWTVDMVERVGWEYDYGRRNLVACGKVSGRYTNADNLYFKVILDPDGNTGRIYTSFKPLF